MKLWFSFDYSGESWGVYLASKIDDPNIGETELAHCDYDKRRVLVWDGLHREARATILIHELLHAVIAPQESAFNSVVKARRKSNAEREEAIVQFIAGPLATILVSAGMLKIPRLPK